MATKQRKLTAKQVVSRLSRDELRDAAWMRLSNQADDLVRIAGLREDEVSVLHLSVAASRLKFADGSFDTGRARSLADAVISGLAMNKVPPVKVRIRKKR